MLLGALVAFGPLATDMYLPAFPAIGAALRADPAVLQATLAGFFLGTGLGQLVYGPLADRFGRRPPLLAGITLFTLASLGCALAHSAEWLAWLRLLQGLGGCAGMVVARAVARDLTQGPAMVRLMSQLMLVVGLAPILAPSLGGLLLGGFGWRAIFWVLTAYGAALLLAAGFGLPETLPAPARRRDGPAAVLGVYLGLLRNRRFMADALAGAFSMAGMFAYIGGSPFVFMQLHGVSPGGYALFFGLNAVGLVGTAQVNARLARHVAPIQALRAAQAVQAAAGLALLLVALTGWGGLPAIAALLFVFISGIGAVTPLATALAMAPLGRVAGSASALIGALQFCGGAASGALVGALQDGTAVPMALVLALSGLAGLALPMALRHRLAPEAAPPSAAAAAPQPLRQ